MFEETGKRVLNLIKELYLGNFISEMTKKMALSNTNSTSNTAILHLDQNSQTYTSRKTNKAILTKLPKGVTIVSMDVTSLYTNIPREEGIRINIVCTANEPFYSDTPPIPKRLLGKALRLILQENSFQFNKRNYLQTHGTVIA